MSRMMIRPFSVLALGLALGLTLGTVPASAQLFGPSDEEKAREAAQDSGLHDLQGVSQQQDARIRELEDRVRGLTQSLSQATGANEELGHQIQLQNEKLDRMEKDFAYRLCTLSAQQLGANDAINCTGAGPASASALPPPRTMRPGDALPPIGSDNGPAVSGRPPGILGSLPAGPGAVPAPPSGRSAQYGQAADFMSRAETSPGQAGFSGHADANPAVGELSPE